MMLIILGCCIEFSFQHNLVSFKWREHYPWFMDRETEALKEHKD